MPVLPILLIEDDRDLARILEHVLIDADYKVEVVGTVAAAYQSISRGSYSLVIADLRLPDGSGAEVADEAAKHGIKTAILSGYAHQLTREVADRHEIMLKPMRPMELITTVRRLIG